MKIERLKKYFNENEKNELNCLSNIELNDLKKNEEVRAALKRIYKEVYVEQDEFNAIEEYLYNLKNCNSILSSLNCSDSDNVIGSNDIYNSKYIKDSIHVNNSWRITYSKRCLNASKVISSTNIIYSNDISCSNHVIQSDSITESNFIKNSEGIRKSNYVQDSNYINESNSVFNSTFCSRCTNIKNCIACYDIKNAENMIFNKKVDLSTIELLKLFLREAAIKPFVLFDNEKIGFKSKVVLDNCRTFFERVDSEFYDWVKLLPNYDENISYNIKNI